jgi:putative phage-type endonuclease
MQYREIEYHSEQEWLELRKNGIGGSDAGAVMGKNKYKNILQLWEEKTGRKTDNFKSSAAQRGNDLEEYIRNSYRIDNPDKEILEVNKMYIHSEYDFIRANLDGEIIFQDKKGILEIKTTTINDYEIYKREWLNNIPESYLYQILHYFLVTGYEFAVLVADIRFKCFETSTPFDLEKKIQTIVINRADWEDEIQELLKKEIEFWQCVKNDTEPHIIKTYGG